MSDNESGSLSAAAKSLRTRLVAMVIASLTTIQLAMAPVAADEECHINPDECDEYGRGAWDEFIGNIAELAFSSVQGLSGVLVVVGAFFLVTIGGRKSRKLAWGGLVLLAIVIGFNLIVGGLTWAFDVDPTT